MKKKIKAYNFKRFEKEMRVFKEKDQFKSLDTCFDKNMEFIKLLSQRFFTRSKKMKDIEVDAMLKHFKRKYSDGERSLIMVLIGITLQNHIKSSSTYKNIIKDLQSFNKVYPNFKFEVD